MTTRTCMWSSCVAAIPGWCAPAWPSGAMPGARQVRRKNEDSYWPYLTKRVAGFVPQFATLQGLTDISPGRNLQAIPYGTFAGARFLDTEAPALRTANDHRLGLDFKAVLRDALTLDATANPDFS